MHVQKADIWSCGVILYTLLYGRFPFQGSDPLYAAKITKAEYSYPSNVNVDPLCKHLIDHILVSLTAPLQVLPGLA